MKFRDLTRQYLACKSEIDASINNVLASGNFIQGTEVQQVEAQLAKKVERKYCLTCANGTEAIMLILMALNVTAGDAVFVPDMTFIATANAVTILGATPIFVDIDSQTHNLSPIELKVAIEKTVSDGILKPKAIIAVDMNGLPADYEAIEKIAKEYKLFVVEDGAQSFGGSINERKAGSFGTASAVSFFPAKPFGCYGDGGAIFCDDDSLAEILNSIRFHGRSDKDKYDNIRLGINSRLDTIQAAILSAKLPKYFSYEMPKVQQIAKIYDNNLSKNLGLPHIPDGYTSSFCYYSVMAESMAERDKIREHLLNMGIPTLIYYPKPLHKQKVYASLEYTDGNFFNTIDYSERTFALPLHAYLEDIEVQQIIKETNKFFS